MNTTPRLSKLSFSLLLSLSLTAASVAACSSHGGSSSSSSPLTIACKSSTKVDTDCTSQGMPHKFSCKLPGSIEQALSAGCVHEHADDPTDEGVCCPTGVEGSTPSSSEDGGTSEASSASAPLCSPKSGSCKSDSDCACGQSCYPTAVCSTCGKRCNFSCTTDQDCVEATKNSTVKLTRCVKTSPNYEIYACQS